MKLFIIFFLTIVLVACKEKSLPILGHRQEINGQTFYSKVPTFQLFDQDSLVIDSNSLAGYYHIACFFFSSCPTICPKVMRSMKHLENELKNRNDIQYLCFSIDHKRDSIPRLKEYYQRLGIESKQFHLLHLPNQSDVKSISEKYMSTALEDPDAPGGFDHSGWILLVDKDRHLRAYANGTDEQEVKRLLKDIKKLMNEKTN